MDFVGWCDSVLSKIGELADADPTVREAGVFLDQVSYAVFGQARATDPGFRTTKQFEALLQAISHLEGLGFLRQRGQSLFWRVQDRGYLHLRDPVATWEPICQRWLEARQEAVLTTVNSLSPREADDHSWVEEVNGEDVLSRLAWPQGDTWLHAVMSELAEAGLLDWSGTALGSVALRSTYAGLVWETRRSYTIEAREIDRLVKGGETTSVERKRELHLDAADEKAEFIKDVLGLANTRSSPPRVLVSGFAPTSEAPYFGPPDKTVPQERIEDLLSAYTDPVVAVQYRVVNHTAGLVGRLDVLRNPSQLPYRVRKSISGKKKRIEAGTIFVRHGSHTEPPTEQEELNLLKERDEVRSSGEA